ncbi:hypothetical protein JTB14_015764 [Gonioctena quinquepunctata]|nr:hypothetical protein JTB14_015764 [Gonioctena quinquepunctata]
MISNVHCSEAETPWAASSSPPTQDPNAQALSPLTDPTLATQTIIETPIIYYVTIVIIIPSLNEICEELRIEYYREYAEHLYAQYQEEIPRAPRALEYETRHWYVTKASGNL